MTDILNEQTTMPPPPPTGPRPMYPPTPAAHKRNPLVTVLIILIALTVAGGLFVGAYLIGANSRDSEVKTAEDATKAVTADLTDTETELTDVESELIDVKSDLADVEADLAACDIQAARRVFNEVSNMYREILAQYGDYLDNFDSYFFVDFDAIDNAGHGWNYNGRHTYPKAFAAAIATCSDIDGNTV